MSGPDTAIRRTGADGWLARWTDLERGLDEGMAGWLRASQLRGVLRFTPVVMAVNLVNAAIVVGSSWHLVSHVVLLGWFAVLSLVVGQGIRGWYRATKRRPTRWASTSATRRATLHACVLGLMWAVVPVALYPSSDAQAQTFIAAVVSGMIGGGALALASIPRAATAYVAILGTGSIVALVASHGTGTVVLTVLLVVYCLIAISGAWNCANLLAGRIHAEADLTRESEEVAVLLQEFERHSNDSLWEMNADGRLTRASPRLEQALHVPASAWSQHEALSILGRQVPSEPQALTAWHSLRDAFAACRPFDSMVLQVEVGGLARVWAISGRPLSNARGRHLGWRGVVADVTDQVNARQRVEWLTCNDELTGLPNRSQFRQYIASLLDDPSRTFTPFAVMTLNLDSFKNVNERFGHAVGDEVLCWVARRLEAASRRTDIVARLGADEFGIVLSDIGGEANALVYLERLRSDLAADNRIGSHGIPLRFSGGIAVAPANGNSADALLSCADAALHEAKRLGGDRRLQYQPRFKTQPQRRLALRQCLRDAIDLGELRLEYQPQICLRSGRVLGFEAMLRWNSALHGEVAPAELIPIAESAGLMPALGRWVAAQACDAARRWPQDIRISINVSPSQFSEPLFFEEVRAATSSIPADRVELEITESILLANTEEIVGQLDALRGHGYRIGLDDFGSGFSSMAYLRRFRFDTLKIDRSIVQDVALCGEARAIVHAILSLSQTLGIDTVAEGVGSMDEALLLQQAGCAAIQGFLVSQAMPLDKVGEFLAAWNHDEFHSSLFESTARLRR